MWVVTWITRSPRAVSIIETSGVPVRWASSSVWPGKRWPAGVQGLLADGGGADGVRLAGQHQLQARSMQRKAASPATAETAPKGRSGGHQAQVDAVDGARRKCASPGPATARIAKVESTSAAGLAQARGVADHQRAAASRRARRGPGCA